MEKLIMKDFKQFAIESVGGIKIIQSIGY